jgi:hypothetical protein
MCHWHPASAFFRSNPCGLQLGNSLQRVWLEIECKEMQTPVELDPPRCFCRDHWRDASGTRQFAVCHRVACPPVLLATGKTRHGWASYPTMAPRQTNRSALKQLVYHAPLADR